MKSKKEKVCVICDAKFYYDMRSCDGMYNVCNVCIDWYARIIGIGYELTIHDDTERIMRQVSYGIGKDRYGKVANYS